MNKNSRIYLAGHKGLAGSAFMRRLKADGFTNVITRSHAELDLTSQADVSAFFNEIKPEYVILAAAKVGGIYANSTFPAQFIHANLAIQTNVIHQAYVSGVRRLLFLGSSCIYPRDAAQPIDEGQLLSGPLEPTNAAYAMAKIAGIQMCWAYNKQYGTHFIPVMPTNLFGPNDNFDLNNAHVLPALIRKFHLAKLARDGDTASIHADAQRFGPIPENVLNHLKLHPDAISKEAPVVEVWGTGTPRREFLHADDLADAGILMMQTPIDTLCAQSDLEPDRWLFNIGTGQDATVAQIVEMVAEGVGYTGKIRWNRSMPDGTPRKCLDIRRMTKLGWQPAIGLKAGIKQTYDWYRSVA